MAIEGRFLAPAAAGPQLAIGVRSAVNRARVVAVPQVPPTKLDNTRCRNWGSGPVADDISI